MKFCPECGAKLAGTAAKFCGECGHKLEQQVPVAQPASSPGSAESSEKEESELNEAQDPSTDPARLSVLAASSDVEVREGVASNLSTPSDVLTSLAQDESLNVIRGVAGNRSTPSEVLAALADNADVHWSLAGNLSVPAEVLSILASDSNKNVREQVAKNPKTPMSSLEALYEDSDVGWCVSGNPSVTVLTVEAEQSTDDARLSELAQSVFPFVRAAVERNPLRTGRPIGVEEYLVKGRFSFEKDMVYVNDDGMLCYEFVIESKSEPDIEDIKAAIGRDAIVLLPESTDGRLTLATRSETASRDFKARAMLYEVDGRLLKESGDVAGARLLWERAAEDGNSDAMVNLGVLLEEAGDLAGAQQWYARAEAAKQQ